MRTITRKMLNLAVVLVALAAAFGFGSLSTTAFAACTPTVTNALYAKTGTATLFGSTSVPIWGFSPSAAGASGIPGPVLEAHVGDCVQVTLYNVNIPESTSLLFQGQQMVPDTTGVAAGGSRAYTFSPASPGTFLYEAGLVSNSQHQVAMGLYGALIVRPSIAGQAYDDPSTAYTKELVMVLSELDTALNTSGTPAAFDMRNYNPKYFLINGKAHPGTVPFTVAAADKVLLRYVNAGIQAHSMGTLGLTQTILAQDGVPYPHTHMVSAETIASGQTLDTIATIPVSAPAGSKFAVHDTNMLLRNYSGAGVSGFGGMVAFLAIGGTAPAGGPVTSNVTITPKVTNGATSVTLAATLTASSGFSLTAAEYFVDAVGANGSGCPITGASGSTANVSIVIPTSGGSSQCPSLATLSSAKHAYYVHASDTSGLWGAAASAVLNLDKLGPLVTGLALLPNPTNGTVNVVVNATADDSTTGGSNISAAEYWIDGSAHFAMTVSGTVPIASLIATIPVATVNALAAGSHTVSVRSQDSLGNWGNASTINLLIDRTGPGASGISASPNPTNTQIGYNTSTQAVRVFATFSDGSSGGSNIAAAEGFLDTVGANGTGFVFVANDGNFNSVTESGFADVPLSVLAPLSNGNHTLYLHAKDAAGNWGANVTLTLVIDKAAPIITGATLTPSTIAFGTASVGLAVSATDAGTGVTGGQYWIDGTATTPTTILSFSGTSTSISTASLGGGVHTVYVQVKDGAQNWSSVVGVTLTVIQAVDDSRSITATTSASQTSDATAASGLLLNDQPIGLAGRTAGIVSAPVRTGGTGTGTMVISCPASLGIAATPPVGSSTVCTNGAYRVTLNGVGANGNLIRSSKRGTFQFSYRENLNGASSTATVTIVVN